MKDTNSIYAEVKLNKNKLNEFLKSVEPNVIAGKLTLKEIKETVMDNLTDFFDVKILENK